MSETKTEEITCAHCGTIFAMNCVLYELRKEDGGPFWCPNGHRLNWQKSRLNQLEEAQERITELEEETRELSAEVTRLKCELVKNAKPLWKRIL